MADYPPGLPCAPVQGTMRRSLVSRKDSFIPSVGGRPVYGVRFTGSTWQTSCVIKVSRTVQLPIWEEFYEVTLKNGAARFNMNNLMTFSVARVCQFVGDPPEPYDSGTWRSWLIPLTFVSWAP